MEITLESEVAVVTGAGRGLGRAYAIALAAAGASVVVNDVDEAAAAETVGAIGGRSVAEVRAVGDSDAAEALVERAVAEYGRLDVLVTDAGLLRDRVLWKMTDDDFDDVVSVRLRGTFTCARAAAVRMRARAGAAGGRGRLPRRPASATSARPTTPPPRPGSSPSPAPGRSSSAAGHLGQRDPCRPRGRG